MKLLGKLINTKINNISNDCEFDRRYWSREIFKINGRIDTARTLDEKRKIQKEFIEKMNKYFDRHTKLFGFHLNIPVININKNEKFILNYFI